MANKTINESEVVRTEMRAVLRASEVMTSNYTSQLEDIER